MRLFGFEIGRAKSAVAATTVPSGWNWLNGGSSWLPVVREPFTGAWQRNMEIRTESVLTYSAVYACVTLIASDVAKVRLRLMELGNTDGIWSETFSSAFSPVLRKPNRYQNRIKFIEQWIISRLIHGNTYVLLERDLRGVVIAMYVLDACRVRPLVAPDGTVYYELSRDNLAGVDQERLVVPASEIIHDTMVCLYHPLCGVSPITACGMAALQGMNIQKNSSGFFANGSKPGGILTAPGEIAQATADRLKSYWEENFTGANVGRVAVLGDGLKYESMSVNAVDAQLIEQLKWTAENVCTAFHVPPYMIGVGPAPTYNNIEALNQQYYAQCLQSIIKNIQMCLNEGLGLSDLVGKIYGTQFDLDDLLLMDTATKVKSVADSISAGFLKPNEARSKFQLKPVEGGDTPYLQQQNFSLAALNKRDQGADPFATNKPPTPAQITPPADVGGGGKEIGEEDLAAAAQLAAWELKRQLDLLAA